MTPPCTATGEKVDATSPPSPRSTSAATPGTRAASPDTPTTPTTPLSVSLAKLPEDIVSSGVARVGPCGKLLAMVKRSKLTLIKYYFKLGDMLPFLT